MQPAVGPEPIDESDQILAEMMQCIDAGQRVDRAALRAAFPALADELCAYLDTADRVERMAGPTAQSLESRGHLETVAFAPYEIADPARTLASITGELSTPESGTIFGDYELQEEIARGGMGVVFKAKQLKLSRTVAVKMILSGRLATKDDVARFRQEAEAAANLSHENIVDIYEVGEVDGHHYFSMEYVPGSDLGRLVRERPLTAERAAKYVRDVAMAIQFAHDRGILHRDLKPSNVLIDADDRPQVTDFGLAKRVRGEEGLTDTGQVVGTPSYMPPEQAWPGQGEIGPASDVYSLGAILYEVLTGRPPFRAATVMDTLMQVLDTEPASPRLLNNKVPRDLETICLKCLAKDPQRRYATAREMQDELDRFLAGQPIKARPINVVARLARWSRRNPVAAGLLASSMLLLIVVGALAFSTARTLETQLRGVMRQSLAYSAEHVAHTVRDRLNELAAPVLATSRNPGLADLVKKGSSPALQAFMTPANGFEAGGGTSTETTWIVLDATGKGLMRSPEPEEFVNVDWRWRDYVSGCIKNGRWITPHTPYISRPYHSRLGKLHKFAIVAPIYDRDSNVDGAIAGIVARTFATDADLGVRELHDEFRQVVVVALDDPDSKNDLKVVPQHRIIVHKSYTHPGEMAERMAEGKLLERLKEFDGAMGHPGNVSPAEPITDDAYVDPMDDGHWLAAMVRVPRSPFWIIIQERADEAVGLSSVAGRLSLWSTIALGISVLIMSNAVGHAIRRGTWRRA